MNNEHVDLANFNDMLKNSRVIKIDSDEVSIALHLTYNNDFHAVFVIDKNYPNNTTLQECCCSGWASDDPDHLKIIRVSMGHGSRFKCPYT